MTAKTRKPMYRLNDDGGHNAPDYKRVVGMLTDEELDEELVLRRGHPDYQSECIAEFNRRRRRQGE